MDAKGGTVLGACSLRHAERARAVAARLALCRERCCARAAAAPARCSRISSRRLLRRELRLLKLSCLRRSARCATAAEVLGIVLGLAFILGITALWKRYIGSNGPFR
jgi:hypothetical protein